MTNQEFTSRMQKIENLLFSFALRLTRSRQDAEDLIQEATIKAYRHRDRFQKGTNFKSWVSTILRNTFINGYRKAKSRRHINQTVEDFNYTFENSGSTQNEGEQSLRMKELIGMMESMSQIYSVPFMMFYRGYEYQEIAKQLNIPIGTVKSRIFLARRKMKEMIGNRYAA